MVTILKTVLDHYVVKVQLGVNTHVIKKSIHNINDWIEFEVLWLNTNITDVLEHKKLYVYKTFTLKRKLYDMFARAIVINNGDFEKTLHYAATLVGAQDLSSAQMVVRNMVPISYMIEAATIAVY